MRHITASGRIKRSRGAMYIFMATIGLAFFYLAGVMTIDLGKVIVAHRQLNTATNAAATAGAWTFDNLSADPALDKTKAKQVAGSTYCAAIVDTVNAAKPNTGVRPASVGDCEDPDPSVGGGSKSVKGSDLGATFEATETKDRFGNDIWVGMTVTGTAKLDDLVFFGLILGEQSLTITSTSTADLCTPGGPASGGDCARPLPG